MWFAPFCLPRQGAARSLEGDNVPDFNDVWGGAGPDCSEAPAGPGTRR